MVYSSNFCISRSRGFPIFYHPICINASGGLPILILSPLICYFYVCIGRPPDAYSLPTISFYYIYITRLLGTLRIFLMPISFLSKYCASLSAPTEGPVVVHPLPKDYIFTLTIHLETIKINTSWPSCSCS